ncbi:integrase [Leifsonia sp. AK011]|uniref:site-specific integrase n=1 Tax=Leifsonia sp. AK011 TaxID=2723075 RepID=UPI0015CD6B8C|nr:tyrosine-type recombinase/integrase [Leifsonia sp. AK011]NYF10805.1 integrase [Leifsonia sp. AK011]
MTDARGWLSMQQAAIVKGDWSPTLARRQGEAKKSRAGTFTEYAEQWMLTRTNRHGEGLRDRTRVEYQRLLNGPLSSFDGLRLNAITPEMVREWYSVQVASGRLTQAARAYGLLKSVLATALEDGRIPTNPCLVRGAQNASTGRKVEPPTSAELAVLVEAITDRYKAAVIISAWGGLRFGELTELRRKDLAVTDDTVIVNVTRAVTHTTGLGFVVGKTKSAAGVRSVMLPPHVSEAVTRHLADHVDDSPDALLFPASDGVTHLAASTFAKHFYPARERAGRPDMPFHALRHYGATKFAQTGATLREIQERIGHSTVAAAMRYQHSAGRDTELARRMSDLAE